MDKKALDLYTLHKIVEEEGMLSQTHTVNEKDPLKLLFRWYGIYNKGQEMDYNCH